MSIEECNDKKATHYFMCHMTQDEFTEFKKDVNEFKLNIICRTKMKKEVDIEILRYENVR